MARNPAKKPAKVPAKKVASKKPALAVVGGTAADEPKPVTPAAGRKVRPDHNGGLSQDTTLRHAANLRRLKDLADKASANYRNARKAAKDDGVPLASLDRVMREQSMTAEELIEQHNQIVSIRRFLAIPIGSQLSFLDPVDGEQTPEKIRAHAKAEGERAALGGENATASPHDPNSDSSRSWMDGWEIGQEKQRQAMQATMEKKNAAKVAKPAKAARPAPVDPERDDDAGDDGEPEVRF